MSFHCHGFTGQRDSLNAFSWSWFHRPEGFFQCLFIVMVSQGTWILAMSCHCHYELLFPFSMHCCGKFPMVSLVVDIELAVNLAIELAVNLQKQQSVRDDLGGRVSCDARLPGCRRRLGICRKRGLGDRPLGHRPYTRAKKKARPHLEMDAKQVAVARRYRTGQRRGRPQRPEVRSTFFTPPHDSDTCKCGSGGFEPPFPSSAASRPKGGVLTTNTNTQTQKNTNAQTQAENTQKHNHAKTQPRKTQTQKHKNTNAQKYKHEKTQIHNHTNKTHTNTENTSRKTQKHNHTKTQKQKQKHKHNNTNTKKRKNPTRKHAKTQTRKHKQSLQVFQVSA